MICVRSEARMHVSRHLRETGIEMLSDERTSDQMRRDNAERTSAWHRSTAVGIIEIARRHRRTCWWRCSGQTLQVGLLECGVLELSFGSGLLACVFNLSVKLASFVVVEEHTGRLRIAAAGRVAASVLRESVIVHKRDVL